MSTGDDFQDKMEDEQYEVKGEVLRSDPVTIWTGRILEIVSLLAIVFVVVMGCIALFRLVF